MRKKSKIKWKKLISPYPKNGKVWIYCPSYIKSICLISVDFLPYLIDATYWHPFTTLPPSPPNDSKT